MFEIEVTLPNVVPFEEVKVRLEEFNEQVKCGDITMVQKESLIPNKYVILISSTQLDGLFLAGFATRDVIGEEMMIQGNSNDQG